MSIKITLPDSQREVEIKRLPLDVFKRCQQRAKDELESEAPKRPTQRVETAPGQFSEEPVDSDAYDHALARWHEKVAARTSTHLIKIVQTVGIVTQVDQNELNETRAIYRDLGFDLPDTDREVWVNYCLAPSQNDQATLVFEIVGRSLPSKEALQLQRAIFRTHV